MMVYDWEIAQDILEGVQEDDTERLLSAVEELEGKKQLDQEDLINLALAYEAGDGEVEEYVEKVVEKPDENISLPAIAASGTSGYLLGDIIYDVVEKDPIEFLELGLNLDTAASITVAMAAVNLYLYSRWRNEKEYDLESVEESLPEAAYNLNNPETQEAARIIYND